MNRIVRHALILTACFALGAGGGTWMADRSNLVPADGARGTSATASPAATAAATGTGREETDPVSKLVTAVSIKNPLERSFRLYEALGTIGSAEIAELLERTSRFPQDKRIALREALFTRWMQIDPAAAGEWVRPHVARAIGRSTIGDPREPAGIWCAAAPEAALQEAARRPFCRGSGSLASRAALALAKGDHAAALARIDALNDPRLRESATADLLGEWSESDPAAAVALFSRLESPQEREATARIVLPALAVRDPAAALRAADEILPSFLPATAEHLAGNLAASAGKAAAEWAISQTGDLRLAATNAVFSTWMMKDPLAALQWAERENLFDSPKFAGGDYLSQSAPGENIALRDAVLGLPDSLGRSRMVLWLIPKMSDEDARSTLLSLPEKARAEAASSFLADKFSMLTPDTASEVMSSLPAGAARIGAARILGPVFAMRFPDKLDSFLTSLTDPAERDAAAREAVTNMYRRPTQAIAVASGIGAPELRDQALAEVFRSWSWYDAGAAHAWLEKSDLSTEWRDVLRAEARER